MSVKMNAAYRGMSFPKSIRLQSAKPEESVNLVFMVKAQAKRERKMARNREYHETHFENPQVFEARFDD